MNIAYKQLLFDQFTPIAIYSKLKKRFPNEISLLFESAVNSESGNFSFIFIGARERITLKDDETFYTKGNKTTKIDKNPFEFLKSYYKDIDKSNFTIISIHIITSVAIV